MPLVRLAVLALEPALHAALGVLAALASPRALLAAGGAVFLLTVAGWALLLGRGVLRHPRAWSFVALPAVFSAATFVMLLLVESKWSQALIAALAAAATGRYAWHLLVYFYFTSKYRRLSLPGSSQALALVAVFFLGFETAALATYLALPPLAAAPPLFVATAVVVASGLAAYRISVRRSLDITLFSALLLTELYGVLILLPVPPAVAGALFAILYYAASGIARLTLEGALSRPLVLRYAVTSALGAAAVLGTARWT